MSESGTSYKLKFSHTHHAAVFAGLSFCLLYFLHHLPVNHLFIDPFSEAIKQHDIMDISFSKFRNHNQTQLFDHRIFVINSGITDRKKIATTIDLVNKKGAAAIGLDLLIDTLYNSPDDHFLKQSIQEASDKLVLGYSFSESRNNQSRFIDLQSHPYFSSDVINAYVNLSSNDGFSVRAFLPYATIDQKIRPAFATKLASMLDPECERDLKKRNTTSEWINFRRVQPDPRSMLFPINSGKVAHYMLVNIDKFIADSTLYDKDYFANKIVLIGFCGENVNSFSMNDRYFTPLNEQYTGRSLPDMYGVFIHANIISMLLDRDFIKDVSNNVSYIIVFLIFFINYLIFKYIVRKYRFLQRIFIRLFQVMEFMVLFTLAILVLVFWSLKPGFFMIATAIILSFELFEIYQRKMDDYIDKILSRLSAFFSKLKLPNFRDN